MMEKQYIATQTKTFTDGQALADIIKGRKYLADRDGEWFIDEFEEKRYLPQDEFDEFFRPIKQKSYQNKAKKSYQKRAVQQGKNKMLVITLFGDKDRDIIEHLDGLKETAEQKRASKGGRGGKTEYIRRLIREDIARNEGV